MTESPKPQFAIYTTDILYQLQIPTVEKVQVKKLQTSCCRRRLPSPPHRLPIRFSTDFSTIARPQLSFNSSHCPQTCSRTSFSLRTRLPCYQCCAPHRPCPRCCWPPSLLSGYSFARERLLSSRFRIPAHVSSSPQYNSSDFLFRVPTASSAASRQLCPTPPAPSLFQATPRNITTITTSAAAEPRPPFPL
jgi:hypothetical protein